jgi:hypothetical protein
MQDAGLIGGNVPVSAPAASARQANATDSSMAKPETRIAMSGVIADPAA